MFGTRAALALGIVLIPVFAISGQPPSGREVPVSANSNTGLDTSRIVEDHVAAELDWRSYHLNRSSAKRTDWQRGQTTWSDSPTTPAD